MTVGTNAWVDDACRPCDIQFHGALFCALLLSFVTIMLLSPAAAWGQEHMTMRLSHRALSGDSDADALADGLDRTETPQACAFIANAAYRQDRRALPLGRADANFAANMASCGKRFDAKTVESRQLPFAILSYKSGGLDDQLLVALDREIDTAPSDSLRAEYIVRAIYTVTSGNGYVPPAQLARAEQYMTHLEGLSDISFATRVRGHTQLSWAYTDADPHFQSHIERAVAAASAMPLAERKTTTGWLAYQSAYSALANLYALRGQFARAVATIDDCLAKAEDGAIPDLLPLAMRQRYALVGKPAPAVRASHWLNAPAGTVAADLRNPVTLLVFAMPTCSTCRDGYPTLRKLYARYQAQGFRPMIVSSLTGMLASGDSAKVAQELADDRRVWIQGDSLPFPIAIANPAEDGVKADGRLVSSILANYAIDGTPMYFFVDKRGIVRHVQSGHTSDLEARLTAVIEKMLAEG